MSADSGETRQDPRDFARDELPLPADAPPIAPLRDVIDRLRRGGIEPALGGSGLLAAFGLSDRIGDWDLTCEAAADAIASCLAGLDTARAGPGGIHFDHKVMLPSRRIECIARFTILSEHGPVRIPTRVTRTWLGLPVGSPTAWAVAYALLGRTAKSERLFEHLASVGVDAGTAELLRSEPLPEALVRRLEAASAAYSSRAASDVRASPSS